MPQNQVQFQHGLSIPEFMERYGTEEQYDKALEKARWLNGYVCSNTILGNVKNAIVGTYRWSRSAYFPQYLAGFHYRFNRRFNLKALLPRVIHAAFVGGLAEVGCESLIIRLKNGHLKPANKSRCIPL